MCVSFVFCLFQIENLYLLPLADELAYINPLLLDHNWSFFLPWNYEPEHFMGHPMGQPLILWLVFKLFGADMFIVKTMSLGFSVLSLFTFYKMIEVLFKDQWVAFISTVFTIFCPLFWYHSTLALTEIPLMAFGFWSVYALMGNRHKTLLLVSCALVLIRESSLAFLCPIVLASLFAPAYRKAFLYTCPALLLFFSHFFIFFYQTRPLVSPPSCLRGTPISP